jgi:putative Mn2+ efflux pump MntP
MNLLVVFGVALSLALDAFAVSVGISLSQKGITRSQTLRLAFSFGLFQFAMPVIGWLAGKSILKLIKDVDHWVAFGLLVLIGSKMIYESFKRGAKKEKADSDPTKGGSLLMLSIATSIDALAVGLSLAALHLEILYPAAIIGIVAFILTYTGAKIGPVLGQVVGKRAELSGGLILILIGIKILFEHL